MTPFPLTIVSPRGRVWNQPVDMVSVPGWEGELGVLAHHAPLLSALRRGICRVQKDGQTTYFVTGEGVIEVTHDEVVVLVDTAEEAENSEQAHLKLQQHLGETAAVPAKNGGH